VYQIEFKGEKLKILHVAELVKGGVATILNELVKSQSANAENNVQILVNKQHFEYVEADIVHSYSGRRNLFGLLRFAAAILRIYLQEKPDVIHLHSSFSGLVARLVLLPVKVKIIYQPHGVSFDKQRVQGVKRSLLGFVEKILSYKAAQIIAISKYELAQLAMFLPAEKLVLVNNAVVDVEYKKEHCRNGRLLFVGRFDRQKGLDILLNYYKKNKVSYPLDIVGSKVIATEEVDSSGIENVNFLGWKTSGQLVGLYGQYSGVIMPSRWEGFGLVAIEALRSGTPVLCSNIGALPFIVKHGLNGFVFDLKNVEQELTSAISSLECADLAQMIESSRAIYLREFTAEKMCHKVFATYQ